MIVVLLELPDADRRLLEAAYEAVAAMTPRTRWDLEDEFGDQARIRVEASPFVQVIDDRLVPNYHAALVLDTERARADTDLVRQALAACRQVCRRSGRTALSESELAEELGCTREAVRRIRFLLDPFLPPVMGTRVLTIGFEETIEFDKSICELDVETCFPSSSIPQSVHLVQAAVLRFYGVREFRDVIRPPQGLVVDNLDFSETTITDSNLSNATIPGIRLVNATLERVSFLGADMSDGVMSGCRMRRVDFLPRDMRGADIDGIEMFDGSQYDARRFETAKWSVIYVDGEACYRTGPAPLVFKSYDLGWAVTLRGQYLGGGFDHAAMGLFAVLCGFPVRDIHVLDLEAAARGTLDDPRCDVTDLELRQLLEANDLQVEKRRLTKLSRAERARLAAVLRYTASSPTEERASTAGDVAEERRSLREHVEVQLVHAGEVAFSQEGPIKTAVARVVRNLTTAKDAFGKAHSDLGAAVERAFTLQEFCRYEPDRITTPPDLKRSKT
jgi:hypothetical protein